MNRQRPADDVESQAATDEQLAEWLASYNAARKEGMDSPPSLSPDLLSPEARVRLRRAQVCLHLLEQARPGRRSAGHADSDTTPSLAPSRRPIQGLSSHEEAVLEVLRQEIQLRQSIGETPQLTEYLQRFPQYAEHLRRDLRDVAGDTEIGTASTTQQPAPAFESAVIPPRVPGYEIVSEIGRGGMGVVYKAWQMRLKRLVALKMIRSGNLAEAEALSRFTREAQTIARLKHPNIVQIYEVGDSSSPTDGAPIPFFAFEYVEGGSLAKELAGALLPANEAAAITEKLARAIHAAHETGIVHRDLKPANVLLSKDQSPNFHVDETSHDDVRHWTPKITDFGLAKHLDTEAGQTCSGLIVGTPSYMAPEQAAGNSQNVGPAVDIYALGAILYEMLTGRPPFKGASSVETVMLVLQEDPVAPSRLRPRMPRDLEVICLKCLEKQPARRYASALALAEDLRRLQAGEPIQARPARWWERGCKWARRRPLVAALTAFCATAFLVLFGVWISFTAKLRTEQSRTQQQRQEALENFQLARASVDRFLTEVSQDPDLAAHGLHPLRKRLLETARDFYEDLVRQRADEPDLRADQGRAYERLGAITFLIGTRDDAAGLYRQAVTVFDELAQQFPKEAAYRVDLARTLRQLGRTYRYLEEPELGQVEVRRAITLTKGLLKEQPGSTQYRAELASAHVDLALLLLEVHRAADAELEYLQALDLQEELYREDPRQVDRITELARTCYDLAEAEAYSETGRRKQAAELTRKALTLREERARLAPADPHARSELAVSLIAATQLDRAAGRAAEAEASNRRALALAEEVVREHPAVSEFRANLAKCYSQRASMARQARNLEEAEEFYTKAVQILEKLAQSDISAADHRIWIGDAQYYLATLHQEAGRLDQAEALFEQILAQMEGLSQRHPARRKFQVEVAGSYGALSSIRRDRGEQKEALTMSSRAVTMLRDVLDREPENSRARLYLRIIHEGRAEALAKWGRPEESLREWEAAHQLFPGKPTPKVLLGRALALVQSGEVTRAWEEAEKLASAKGLTPVQCRDLARVYGFCYQRFTSSASAESAEGAARRAIELLTRAAKPGTKQAKQLPVSAHDAAFELLRQREDFRKALTLFAPPHE